MEHNKLLSIAKEAIANLERDTSVPESQTKEELQGLADDAQTAADAIEGD